MRTTKDILQEQNQMLFASTATTVQDRLRLLPELTKIHTVLVLAFGEDNVRMQAPQFHVYNRLSFIEMDRVLAALDNLGLALKEWVTADWPALYNRDFHHPSLDIKICVWLDRQKTECQLVEVGRETTEVIKYRMECGGDPV